MKYILLLIALLVLWFSAGSIFSCPTCIGRLDRKAPPFFTKEYEEQYFARVEQAANQEQECADDDDECANNNTAAFNRLLKEEA